MASKVELMRNKVLFYLCLLLVFSLLGCAGSTTGPGNPNHPQHLAVPQVSGTQLALSVLPVKMQPQLPEEPEFKSTSFLLPVFIPSAIPGFKCSSAAGDVITTSADQPPFIVPTPERHFELLA
jgi:hypothetical protein